MMWTSFCASFSKLGRRFWAYVRVRGRRSVGCFSPPGLLLGLFIG